MRYRRRQEEEEPTWQEIREAFHAEDLAIGTEERMCRRIAEDRKTIRKLGAMNTLLGAMNTLRMIDPATGRLWNVRVVRKGQILAYGYAHEGDDPMVEFYDAEQDPATFGPLGQPVSGYYLSTLMEPPHGQGLTLDGGVPEWKVSASVVDMALALGRRLQKEKEES